MFESPSIDQNITNLLLSDGHLLNFGSFDWQPLKKQQFLSFRACNAGRCNRIINGKVPHQFQTFLRQTYLVALEKDPDDKTKLRPLEVPSAIRLIAAIIVLKQYSPIFADHLLPFNYAIRHWSKRSS